MQIIRRYDTFDQPYSLLIPVRRRETMRLLKLSIEFEQAKKAAQLSLDEMERKISENLELIRATRQKLLNR